MTEPRNNKCILVLLAAVLAAAPAGAQEIRLRPQATADGPAVVLADVAELRNLPDRVSRIQIARLDNAQAVAITVSQIQTALRHEGVNVASVSFSGAARCSIHRGADVPAEVAPLAGAPAAPMAAPVPAVADGKSSGMPASEAQAGATGEKMAAGTAVGATPAGTVAGQKIREQLLEQLGAGPEELTLTFAPANKQMAQTSLPGPVSVTSVDRNLLGRRTWRVDYEQSGRAFCQRYITGIVQVRRPAVVTRRALPAGSVIAAADVEIVTREDDGRQDRMNSLEVVVGQQVRRALTAGQVIAAGDLKSPILVIRGQLAWVQAGPVQVRARALNQGAEGQTVEFENVQSKGRLWAQVTGPGTAQVAPAAAVK